MITSTELVVVVAEEVVVVEDGCGGEESCTRAMGTSGDIWSSATTAGS